MTPVVQATACLLACICGWIAAIGIMWQINPMTKVYVRKAFSRDNVMLVLGVIGFFIAVCAVIGCSPYRRAQSAEPVECRDEALAVLVAECTARVKATPNTTEKNKIRAECLERVNAWEQCR